MTWFMNFCAPFLPNDSTINFHRYFQTALLALYTLAYAILHIYYKCSGNDSVQEQEKGSKQGEKQSDSDQIDSSEQASEKSKEVSIKIEEQPNQSCIQLKKSATTWENTTRKPTEKETGTVTIYEVENYSPIVYGHFGVAMGVSIMYTPYAEQSIACLLYLVFTIPLLVLNARRQQKCTLFIWGIMVTLLLFILTCGLLQIGQSNWDYINLTCFSTEYVSLYD